MLEVMLHFIDIIAVLIISALVRISKNRYFEVQYKILYLLELNVAEYFISQPTVNTAIPTNTGSAMCGTHIANF